MKLEEYYKRFESRYKIRLVIIILFFISALAYFSWRLTVFNQEALTFSLLFFLAEFFGLVMTLTTIFVTWRVRERKVQNVIPDITVDIFIPTYNESIDIVRLTVLAVKKIRYPHNTWILDDGCREEIEQLAKELDCNYLKRKENIHAKAGNLNNALKHSSADLIAIFDADQVPEENFLERLLGYFNDPDVAYVQTPQDFHNIDSFQFLNRPAKKLIWHDQMFFYQIGQAGRDYWNAASFCGTNAVLRRSALDRIGGIATETVTEDMHTAIRLQKLGYKSVYHPEVLVYGVAATNFVEFLQQRLRWGHGNVQSLREEHLPFCKGLTIPQKICYTALGLVYFEGWPRLLLYFTPVIVLMSGVAPIGDTRLFFHLFIPYFVFAWLCIEEQGRGSARFFVSEYMAMARFPVFLLSSFGLIFKRRHWRITSKERGGEIPAYLIFPQLLIFLCNTVALVVSVISPPELLVQTMSGGTIVVICFWAIFNIMLSGSVIFTVFSRHEAGEKHYFKLPLPVKINGEKETSCIVSKISCDEITFSGEIEPFPKTGSIINCTVFVDNLEINSDIEVMRIDRKDTFICRFLWENENIRDQLNLKLHNCTWHRNRYWNGGFFNTPLESLVLYLRYLDIRHYFRKRGFGN